MWAGVAWAGKSKVCAAAVQSLVDMLNDGVKLVPGLVISNKLLWPWDNLLHLKADQYFYSSSQPGCSLELVSILPNITDDETWCCFGESGLTAFARKQLQSTPFCKNEVQFCLLPCILVTYLCVAQDAIPYAQQFFLLSQILHEGGYHNAIDHFLPASSSFLN